MAVAGEFKLEARQEERRKRENVNVAGSRAVDEPNSSRSG